MNNIDMALIGNSPAAALVILMIAMGKALARDSRTHNQFRGVFDQLSEAADLPKRKILLKTVNRIAEGAIVAEDVRHLEDLIRDMESVVCRP